LQDVWLKLKGILVAGPRGATAKVSRWFAWEARGGSMLDQKTGGLHALLMVLIYIGWKRKWWSSYKDCPLACLSLDDEAIPIDDGAGLEEDIGSGDSDNGEPEAGLIPEAGPSSSRISMAKGREQVNQKRRLCANAMAFAAKLLAQPLGMRLFKALIAMPKPLHARMAKELEMLKTRRGTLTLHLGLQQGEHTLALHELLDTILSPGFAEQLGFPKARGSDHLQKEDAMVAGTCWRLAFNVVGSFAITQATYTHQLPLALFGLLNPAEGVVTDTLAWLSSVWACLLKLELEGLHDNAAVAFVINLRFPLEQFSRSILVMLAEVEFKEVPCLVVEELTDFANGLHSTLLVENMFREARKLERKSLSGMVGNMHLWHEISHTQLLADFDRPCITVTASSKLAAAANVPRSTFHADVNHCSMDVNEMGSIHDTGKKVTWPTLSPPEVKKAAIRLQCAVFHGGDMAKIEKSWLSLLQVPGSITMQRGSNKPLLVIAAGPHGFLTFSVQIQKVGEKHWLSFGSPSSAVVSYNCVVDHADWRCLPVECLAPGSSKLTADRPKGLTLIAAKGAATSLLKFAGQHGFKQFTVHFLKLLCAELEIIFERGCKPKTEDQFLSALAKHLAPDSAGKALDAMVAQRLPSELVPSPVAATLFSGDYMELLEEEMADESLQAEVAKATEAFASRRARAAAAVRPLGPHMGTSSASSSSGQAVPRARPARKTLPAHPGRGLTLQEGKALFPPGCSVAKDTKLHMRWQVRASWLQPSHSKGFGASDHQTEDSALVYCLQMAWRVYTATFGQDCPFDLDAPIF
jgi:hypothetical protein